jgi:hypothetical protein
MEVSLISGAEYKKEQNQKAQKHLKSNKIQLKKSTKKN